MCWIPKLLVTTIAGILFTRVPWLSSHSSRSSIVCKGSEPSRFALAYVCVSPSERTLERPKPRHPGCGADRKGRPLRLGRRCLHSALNHSLRRGSCGWWYEGGSGRLPSGCLPRGRRVRRTAARHAVRVLSGAGGAGRPGAGTGSTVPGLCCLVAGSPLRARPRAVPGAGSAQDGPWT